jgi:hypothetical protein
MVALLEHQDRAGGTTNMAQMRNATGGGTVRILGVEYKLFGSMDNSTVHCGGNKNRRHGSYLLDWMAEILGTAARSGL